MDISPQRVRTAQFQMVKKGLDPEEVRAFLDEVAAELERAQNQSTAMEARARAAVARLQELSESAAQQGAAEPADEPAAVEPAPVAEVEHAGAPITATVDEAETISRTLLLAQRTADTAIAEAEAEAARIKADADEEAHRTLDSTREMSAKLLEEAREEARRSGEAEKQKIEAEVNSLLARRDFLESDVDHLESFLVDERSRVREAATALLDLVERVPGGLGEVRRPLLSAADDDDSAGTEADASADVTAVAAAPDDAGEAGSPASPGSPDTPDGATGPIGGDASATAPSGGAADVGNASGPSTDDVDIWTSDDAAGRSSSSTTSADSGRLSFGSD